ncbi:QRFP-like peptide [Branchiostoma lanceolatum]|uniref:QRFP-like peptide n=1 Tax=Branchiostoma lanceolatum TaxID=7740 RepID=UPI003452B015
MGVRVPRWSFCVIGLLVLVLTHSDAYKFREKSWRTSPYYRQYGSYFRRDGGDQAPSVTSTGNGENVTPGFDDEGGIYLSDQQAEGGFSAAEKRSAMLQQLAQQLKSRPREKGGFTFRFGKRESRRLTSG